MRFITVRDLRTHPARVWAELPASGEMVITNNGKPVALLTPVSDETLIESVNAFKAACAMNAVSRIQDTAIRSGRCELSQKEIDKEIRQVRIRSRKRPTGS